MKPSELLRKAISEIERRGWMQTWFGGDSQRPGTCAVCAIGGLRAAVTGDPFKADFESPVFGEAREFLLRAMGTNSVVNWNDEQGRTQADVLAAFGRAVSFAEAEGR